MLLLRLATWVYKSQVLNEVQNLLHDILIQRPQADENGYFYLPNVNMPNEMLTIKHTEAMYEANINAFKLSKTMYQSSIELLK